MKCQKRMLTFYQCFPFLISSKQVAVGVLADGLAVTTTIRVKPTSCQSLRSLQDETTSIPLEEFHRSRVKRIIVSVVREREGVEGVGGGRGWGEGDRPVSLLDGLQCSVTLFSRTEACSLVHSK